MFSLITGIISKSGVWGVFLLMLLENLIPFIPSELILPLAGFQAARGQFDPVLAIAAATVGSVMGGFGWYGFGRWIGFKRLGEVAGRYGRWIPVSQNEVDRAHGWFRRRGALAVCIGRALPGIRGIICIPAGMAGMSPIVFLIASTIGAFAWADLLVSSGYALHAKYEIVQQWLNPITDVLLILVAGLYLLRVIRFRTDQSRE